MKHIVQDRWVAFLSYPNNHRNISIIQLRARKWIYFWHSVVELSFTASIELFTLSCAATYLLPVMNYVIKNDVLKKTKTQSKGDSYIDTLHEIEPHFFTIYYWLEYRHVLSKLCLLKAKEIYISRDIVRNKMTNVKHKNSTNYHLKHSNFISSNQKCSFSMSRKC